MNSENNKTIIVRMSLPLTILITDEEIRRIITINNCSIFIIYSQSSHLCVAALKTDIATHRLLALATSPVGAFFAENAKASFLRQQYGREVAFNQAPLSVSVPGDVCGCLDSAALRNEAVDDMTSEFYLVHRFWPSVVNFMENISVH